MSYNTSATPMKSILGLNEASNAKSPGWLNADKNDVARFGEQNFIRPTLNSSAFKMCPTSIDSNHLRRHHPSRIYLGEDFFLYPFL